MHIQVLNWTMIVFAGHSNFSLNYSMWLCQNEALNKVKNSSMCLIKFTLVSFVSLLFSRKANYLYEKVNISLLKANIRPYFSNLVMLEYICYSFGCQKLFFSKQAIDEYCSYFRGSLVSTDD